MTIACNDIIVRQSLNPVYNQRTYKQSPISPSPFHSPHTTPYTLIDHNMSDPLSEDSLRSALETAEAAGDFLTVRSILTSQPRSAYPAWILEPSNLISWLTGALSRSITDAARSGNIESIRALFQDWRECSEPTRLPPVEKEDVDWALVEALKRGDRQVVRVLLAEGAGVTKSVVRALADPKNSEGYGQRLYEDILHDLLEMGGWNVNLDQAIMYPTFLLFHKPLFPQFLSLSLTTTSSTKKPSRSLGQFHSV